MTLAEIEWYEALLRFHSLLHLLKARYDLKAACANIESLVRKR